MAVRITGVGKHLPARVLTNSELEKMVDTSDQWIIERTGIRERRLAAPDEGAASMGIGAAAMALATAGLEGRDIDLVVCATCTPDGMFPATASLIQDAIGARGATAFDVNAACTGFIAGLATAAQFIDSGACRRALVVGSEVFSRILDWTDRATCVLFGDAAGAVVLEAGEQRPTPFVLKSDGAGYKLLYARGPASPVSAVENEGFCVVMDGREVFRFAVRAMEEACRHVLDAAGMAIDDVAFIVPHQANQRIITAVGRSLGLAPERMIVNLEKYGNTSSASIPLALCEAWEEGRLREGDKLILVAFGGGLSWGASVVEWARLGSERLSVEAVSEAAPA